MFFLDDQLCRRRVEDIKLITAGRLEMRGKAERWVHDVEMIDGQKPVILDVIMQQIGKAPAHAFASQPGLQVWTPDAEGAEDFLNPVVRWAVTYDSQILPIVAGGSIDDFESDVVILAADGQVWKNGFVQAPNLAAYKLLIASE